MNGVVERAYGGNGLVHGGGDHLGPVRWDFSSNSNPSGTCPALTQALSQVDVSRYPDPQYLALTQALAQWHGVAPWRIVLAASASEAIARLTRALLGSRSALVQVPAVAYGEYAHAARVAGHTVCHGDEPVPSAGLRWLCDPHSPSGQATLPIPYSSQTPVVLDRAYHPLRLQPCPWSADQLNAVWQVFSPNKALGATGIRGAYVLAPEHAQALAAQLRAAAPSWVLGAHGVAMLHTWVSTAAQQWLAHTAPERQAWTQRLRSGLQQRGWLLSPSDAPFFCARPPNPLDSAALRAAGIKLRATDSMGLVGHWRINALPEPAQDALFAQLDLS